MNLVCCYFYSTDCVMLVEFITLTKWLSEGGHWAQRLIYSLTFYIFIAFFMYKKGEPLIS